MSDDVPLDIAGHDGRERPDGGTEVLSDAGGTDEPTIETPGEEEVEPVEVLVTLAEEGEIDPWDIDVVRVTDKFLERLDEADLRTSGRALFYASVLLRMKSDALLEDDTDEDSEPEMESDPFAERPGEGTGADPFDALDEEMDRRLERKRARGTPRTLDELVRELREAERDTWWKDSREYDTSESPQGFQRGTQELDYHASDDFREEAEPTAADVTDRTHGEDVEELVESVAASLREHYEAGREEVLFAEVDDIGGSRVETFLGVLFLADQGRVDLQQDTWFGDLWLRDPEASGSVETPLAE
ncbi:segregation and condensation protein A [Halorhabdus amylolytica]|uniref:segregation and condensation protein A n=1 Tax=Halorhabdus amylolytica TaxID=2559573 RepID=UPI0010A99D90|nr:ScpA family protein [Halorhabdus amylolytica]